MVTRKVPFRHRLMDEAEDKNTRLMFNLDLSIPIHENIDQSTAIQVAVDTIEEIDDLIAGVMVNRSFGDAVGILGVEEVIKRFDIPFIADYNLCDIDRNVLWMASELYEAGFEAITLPGFIGEEPIKAIQDEFPGEGLVITLSLPHEDKSRFMDQSFEDTAKMANELRVDGVDIAGNRLEDLKRANKLVNEDILVFCNGFGEGKASPGDCLDKEGDFEVVGREIYESKDARETAIRIVEEQRGYWEYDR